MGLEIERKFLVLDASWRDAVVSSRPLRQYYLSRDARSSVRVRIEAEQGAWLTVKSAAAGAARSEFEYAIPTVDALEMMALAEGATIEKIRHIVPYGGLRWEVDVFSGDNQGLVVAEVELSGLNEVVAMPAWIGAEVTGDRRYYNASLAQRPFVSW